MRIIIRSQTLYNLVCFATAHSRHLFCVGAISIRLFGAFLAALLAFVVRNLFRFFRGRRLFLAGCQSCFDLLMEQIVVGVY